LHQPWLLQTPCVRAAGRSPRMIGSFSVLCALAMLVGAAVGTTGAPAGSAELRVSRPVIVETDMDASDAMAILYLLHRADVKVIAIVVDGDGEARCPAGARNALALAALAGKPDIPVGCGRPLPLQGTHAFPTAWRDAADHLWRLPRPTGRTRRTAGSAQRVFRAALRSTPGRVEVLTLGPPTELAALLLRGDAALRDKIRSVTMMGGAVGVPGNVATATHAEWNFHIDPKAASIVVRSGLATTLVPLDATNHMPLSAAVAGRLGRSRSAAFVRRLLRSMPPSLYFWDQLAAAILVEPAIGRYSYMRLAVVQREGPTSGRTVRAVGGGRVSVTVSADRARFERSFASTLR
jgi:inosine-uridine nucleoside N-ribohydrolase